jgi:hypothetical protein
LASRRLAGALALARAPTKAGACAGADVASSRGVRSVSRRISPRLSCLPGRLAVMAGLAQTLETFPVREQLPVSAVRIYVIDHRCPRTNASPGTFAAPRLPKQLSRSQVVSPELKAIPVVPLSRHPSWRLLRLVLRTVSSGDQPRTSWMFARPERFSRHWAITSKVIGKNKKAGANDERSAFKSLAPALQAPALNDIHDVLCPAESAVADDVRARRFGQNLHEPLVAASGTDEISVLYS